MAAAIHQTGMRGCRGVGEGEVLVGGELGDEAAGEGEHPELPEEDQSDDAGMRTMAVRTRFMVQASSRIHARDWLPADRSGPCGAQSWNRHVTSAAYFRSDRRNFVTSQRNAMHRNLCVVLLMTGIVQDQADRQSKESTTLAQYRGTVKWFNNAKGLRLSRA